MHSHVIQAASPGNGPISSLYDMIVAETANDHTHSDEMIISLMVCLLISVSRSYPSGNYFSHENRMVYKFKHYEIVDDAIAYIKANFAEHLTVNTMAKRYNIGRSEFSRIFNALNGMSFPMFLRRCRINNVISLLTNSGRSITDAAYESGFNSISGFYKAFRDITGTIPSDISLVKSYR
jgi:AraC-like DNA-binding protein